jgi:hypothetical protein
MPPTAGSVFRSATIARERLMRPYPHFDTVNTTTNEGYSWYHAFQMRIEKRFSKGYTVGANYTYSKFMEAVEFLTAGDPDPSEVISGDDRPHRFTLNGIYEFPFGKGRQLFADAPPVISQIISGWQISGIYAFQSGPPIGNWGNIIYRGHFGGITIADNQKTIQKWFNTEGGFEKDSAKALSSNVRTFPLRFGFLRADKINNYDFSVIKNTDILEGKTLQFRAEFLNAFNHPLFFTSQINITPTQAAFGGVTATTQANYQRRVQLSLKFLF